MFVAGEIDVQFKALDGGSPTWTVQLPNGGGTLNGGRRLRQLHRHERLARLGVDERHVSLGPLTLQGPTIGLADTSFSKGKLNLTIAIGVDQRDARASAARGRRGVSAKLTGILGTFDVQVDLLQALQSLTNPSGLLAAFSVPGKFTLSVASLSINVPERRHRHGDRDPGQLRPEQGPVAQRRARRSSPSATRPSSSRSSASAAT